MEGTDWKEEYLKEEFVVNSTLTKCTQRKDLQQVTSNLRAYANELHDSMTEILKEETEAIVKLAQGLSKLSTQISKLTTPLTQFHEEILSMYEIVTYAEKIYENHIQKSKDLQMEQYFESVISSINTVALYINNVVMKQLEEHGVDIDQFERAVDEYTINVNRLKELKKAPIDNILDLSINDKLGLLTEKKFMIALNDRNEKLMYCCLRGFVSLNKQTNAELIYKKEVVRPVLEKIFSLKNLKQHNNNLSAVYDKALNFLNHNMSFLLEIIKRNPDLKGYDFVINTYWNTADQLLRDNLPQTTASGNPELFQKRFCNTWNFIQAVMSKSDPKMRKHTSFQDHIKRFNLAVYFEIRHQQICASFERDIVENSGDDLSLKPETNSEFKLKVSAAFWRSMNHCFHPEVFLNHLCDQFFKLSVMLTARYLRYINDMCAKAAADFSGEEFFIHCLLDLTLFKKLLGTNVKENVRSSIYKIMTEEMHELIKATASLNENLFNGTYDGVKMKLIDKITRKGKDLLQHVGSIPRLYRRTNKSTPEEPSFYIVGLVGPIKQFQTSYRDVLKGDMSDIMDSSINEIGKHYLSVIQEVLHSVCKTEESLRRLKSRNVASSEDSSQGADLSSDEAKIREQISLDVSYFLLNLSSFVANPEGEVFKTLKKEAGCSH